MRVYRIVAPGSDEPKAGEADALVLDGRAIAADAVETFRRLGGPRLFVRVAGVETIDADGLAKLVAMRPDVLILPASHGRDIAHLGARLAVHEAEHGLPDGGIGIVALVACAGGVLHAGSFAAASPRLRGLGWDADALAASLGAEALGPDGWSPPLAHVRSTVRLAAAAAGVEAIETAYPGPDAEGVRMTVEAARRDGFGAIFSRDAAQVRLIRAGS